MPKTPRSTRSKPHTLGEVFEVVGAIDGGRTIEEIAVEIECLVHDLRGDAGNGRSCTSNAEIIMHLCADIIALSNQSKKEAAV